MCIYNSQYMNVFVRVYKLTCVGMHIYDSETHNDKRTSTSLQSCLNLHNIQHTIVAPKPLASQTWSLDGGGSTWRTILTELKQMSKAEYHKTALNVQQNSQWHPL